MESKPEKKSLTRDLISEVYRAGQEAATRIDQRAVKAERARLRAAVEKMKKREFKGEGFGYILCSCGVTIQTRNEMPNHYEHLNYGNKHYNIAIDDVLTLLKEAE